MDLAITIGQGLGFGVACGLSTIALLVPLLWPGIDERALGILGAFGLVAAVLDLWLPLSVRFGLRIAAGAAACEFWLHDDLAWAGPRNRRGCCGGDVGGGRSALRERRARRLTAGHGAHPGGRCAARGDWRRWCPSSGTRSAVVAVFLALRTRRRGGERYEGLRILR